MRKSRLVLLITAILVTTGCSIPVFGSSVNKEKVVKTHETEVPSEVVASQVVETPPIENSSCPQYKGLLLFSSQTVQGDYKSFEIFSASADGSNLVQITRNSYWDGNPTWSPNYCQIAFSSDISETNHEEIFVVNADGSNLVQISDDPAQDREPSWSPDGSRITFMRENGGNREIFIVDSNGASEFQLTDNPENDNDPEWSPVNNEIVFSSRRDGNWEIYKVNEDGAGLIRLTNEKMQDTHPTWSPDGSQIAFLSNRSAYNEIYIMDKDGSNLKKITNQGGSTDIGLTIDLSWSSDGQWLAVGCITPETSEALCVVHPDGSSLHLLVNRGGFWSREPDW